MMVLAFRLFHAPLEAFRHPGLQFDPQRLGASEAPSLCSGA